MFGPCFMLGLLWGMGLLLLSHLLLHTAVHLPETFFYFTGSKINGNNQLKDELIEQVGKNSIKNILHAVKIKRPVLSLPDQRVCFTELLSRILFAFVIWSE